MTSRRSWSAEDKRLVLEAAVEVGANRDVIARRVGCTFKQLDNFLVTCRDEYRAALDTFNARQRALRELPGEIAQPVSAVRPFAVPVPKLAHAESPEGHATALVFGDSHVPFHDPQALELVYAILSDLKPDFLVHVGDLVDCWQISRFDKDLMRSDTLQDSIDGARTILHQLAQIAPAAERWLLEGNHENRLQKAMWRTEGAGREVLRLEKVQQTLNWPHQLGLREIGWNFVEYGEQDDRQILPKMIVKHGTVVRKWSGWSAKGEWEASGRSGLSGHSHRIGAFIHRDANGEASWLETGCTCLLKAPYGTRRFDWNQGLVVLEWSKDRRVLEHDIVRFRDGRALWRGHEYKA